MNLKKWLLLASSAVLLGACAPTEEAEETSENASVESTVNMDSVDTAEDVEEKDSSKDTTEEVEENESKSDSTAAKDEKEDGEPKAVAEAETSVPDTQNQLIEVDGGDLSGYREANVVVNIGFGDREYWAFTNEHGQLVRVVAEEIIVQDDDSEPVNSNGRYYYDEAKVPGTESATLDEGHVIADSLGGVANAYNITPQNSTLNRHGDQAYMERTIQQAGGATDFEAIITYPNSTTQTPSSYKYTYTVNGNQVVDEFANVDPDEYNEEHGITGDSEEKSSSNKSSKPAEPKEQPKQKEPETNTSGGDVSSVDANGNGRVTIQEAKDAGFSMPITSDHWLYQYMDDRDGDGMVGE